MEGIVGPRLIVTLTLLCLLGQLFVHCNEAFESDSIFSIDEPRTIVYTAKPEKTTTVTPETTSASVESDGSDAVDPTVCTPAQVICQKVLEMLELIAQEIRVFQEQAQQKIAASERQEVAKGCGLIQLTQLLEQLQRRNASNNRTVEAS